jgi:hypothetical protein
MSRIWGVVLFAAAGFTAVSCATTTEVVSRWSDESYQGRPGQKIMIIALTDNERRQYTWEGAFSNALKQGGAVPLAGSKYLPAGAALKEEGLKEVIRESGANLVAVTRLLAIDKETEYVPGTTAYAPAPAYYGMYGYYQSSYMMLHEPGYIQENTVVKLETNVYDVGTAKLVWSGLTHTINPETGQDAATSVAVAIVSDLTASKIIKKK